MESSPVSGLIRGLIIHILDIHKESNRGVERWHTLICDHCSQLKAAVPEGGGIQSALKQECFIVQWSVDGEFSCQRVDEECREDTVISRE